MSNSHVFALASGENIRVTLCEDSGLGVGGYRINVISDRGMLAAMPRAGNSLDIMTVKGISEEAATREKIVLERDSGKTAKKTGS